MAVKFRTKAARDAYIAAKMEPPTVLLPTPKNKNFSCAPGEAVNECFNCDGPLEWVDGRGRWEHPRVSLGPDFPPTYYHRYRCKSWWNFWNFKTAVRTMSPTPKYPKAVNATSHGTVLIYEEGLTPPPKKLPSRPGTDDTGPW